MECPRLIYKLAELKDKETGVMSKELVCICLTDFEDILVEPESNLAKTLKESDIRSWAAEFGLTAEQLKELVKY